MADTLRPNFHKRAQYRFRRSTSVESDHNIAEQEKQQLEQEILKQKISIHALRRKIGNLEGQNKHKDRLLAEESAENQRLRAEIKQLQQHILSLTPAPRTRSRSPAVVNKRRDSGKCKSLAPKSATFSLQKPRIALSVVHSRSFDVDDEELEMSTHASSGSLSDSTSLQLPAAVPSIICSVSADACAMSPGPASSTAESTAAGANVLSLLCAKEKLADVLSPIEEENNEREEDAGEEGDDDVECLLEGGWIQNSMSKELKLNRTPSLSLSLRMSDDNASIASEWSYAMAGMSPGMSADSMDSMCVERSDPDDEDGSCISDCMFVLGDEDDESRTRRRECSVSYMSDNTVMMMDMLAGSTVMRRIMSEEASTLCAGPVFENKSYDTEADVDAVVRDPFNLMSPRIMGMSITDCML